MFPQVPKDAINILDHTLAFDPRQRLTVEEILQDDFFTDCRRKDIEYGRKPIEMEF